MSTKTVLLKLGVLIETDGDEDVERLERSVIQAIDDALGVDHRSKLGWQSSKPLPLEPGQLNCGRCAVCGAWVTDREAAGPIMELCNGAVVEGRLLCDEHLPPDHRWAF